MKVPNDTAIKLLEDHKETIASLRKNVSYSIEFKKWRRDTEVDIEHIFGVGTRHANDFSSIKYHSLGEGGFNKGLDSAFAALASMIDELKKYGNYTSTANSKSAIDIIENICNKFHKVARQLEKRHSNRSTLKINDEYDVQDLFHSLLHIEFDDIRAEDWNPSYAGACSRVDFILKEEGVVIEIKKTRRSLTSKEIGDELLIDIGRYKSNPLNRALICFVYDPEELINNPRGIEDDLKKSDDDFKVHVFIRPNN